MGAGRRMNVKPGQLLAMLDRALGREEELWSPQLYTKLNQNWGIGPRERDGIVEWLVQLSRRFGFSPDTLALSVNILDRFLHAVKAHKKYLNCITVTCFYLAAKTLEEDEVVPGTLEFVRTSQCGCSVSEVVRMERCVLDKLGWDLRASTSLEFLQLFHSLLLTNHPKLTSGLPHTTPSHHLTILTRKLIGCLCYHPLMAFRPATLALALLSLDMECFMSDWLPVTLTMQSVAQVDSVNLIRCRELLSHRLSRPSTGGCGKTKTKQPAGLADYSKGHNTVHSNISCSAKPAKRKVEEEEEDDIYEGIKRLYNEDPVENLGPSGPGAISCSREARQDTENNQIVQAVF